MSEYDRRQASLVDAKIDEYRQGVVGLGRLISDVVGLSEAMEDRETGSALMDLVNELEIVNASLLFDERGQTEQERKSVEATLVLIKVLVEPPIHARTPPAELRTRDFI